MSSGDKFNPYMSPDVTPRLWTGLFPTEGCLFNFCFIEIPVFNAKNVDPADQMLHSAVSDRGLHCLPIIILLGVSLTKMGLGQD